MANISKKQALADLCEFLKEYTSEHEIGTSQAIDMLDTMSDHLKSCLVRDAMASGRGTLAKVDAEGNIIPLTAEEQAAVMESFQQSTQAKPERKSIGFKVPPTGHGNA